MSKETYDKSQEYSRAKVTSFFLGVELTFAGEVWVPFQSMESSDQFDSHLLQCLAVPLGTHPYLATNLRWLQFPRRSTFPSHCFRITVDDPLCPILLCLPTPSFLPGRPLVTLSDLRNRREIRIQQTNPRTLLQRFRHHTSPVRRHRNTPPHCVPQNHRLFREKDICVLRHVVSGYRPSGYDYRVSGVDSTVV